MQIHITGRHVRLTEALRAYAEQKVLRTRKHVQQILRAQVILSVEKRTHLAEIVLHIPGQMLRAQASAGDLYAAIDLASDKIDQQAKKHKERMIRHKDTPAVPVLLTNEDGRMPVNISIIKKISVRPMTRSDAALEMERLGYSFWMFQDKESRQVSVIYRRLDDSYGLLQPVRKGP